MAAAALGTSSGEGAQWAMIAGGGFGCARSGGAMSGGHHAVGQRCLALEHVAVMCVIYPEAHIVTSYQTTRSNIRAAIECSR
ncbi:hypothetical protein ACP70R_010048 [Stipagrostis hirtigluma subsp. patula]